MTQRAVVAYVSGHGLGHAARSAEVLRALRERDPARPIQVRSAAAPWFLEERLPPDIEVIPVTTDIGVLQPDSFGSDPLGSLKRYADLIARWPERLQEEVAALRAADAGVVFADIPPLGIAAGHAAGLPTFAMGNFGWDWIYRPFLERFAGFEAVGASIADTYALTGRLFRLPLAEPMSAFPRQTDIPLVARVSLRNRDETRRLLGLQPGQRLVLLSFGGFGAGTIGADRLREDPELIFASADLWPGPFPPHGLSYTDVVAASDAVLTKPGFSMLAECLANGTPILAVPREGFIEAPMLIEELRARDWPLEIVPRERLVSGHFVEDVREALERFERPEPVPTGGAEIVAEALLTASLEA
ncbi:MAG: hypothetical protein RL885_21805 [Planctomycetota bacterium]